MAHDPETPDSAPPEQSAAPAETPARHVAEVQKKKNLYLRLTSSMPLAVTVLVHVVLVLGAGAIVVQQNLVEKKKTFEASAASENVAQKQVEHRLQVARRGGASGASGSPIEVNRVFSTAESALQLPPLPDLPALGGAAGFGGFGGAGSGVGLGAGTGMATSLGGGVALGGRGFMSMSFLGITDQNVQNVVFVIDTSSKMMDLRKSGFRAFEIIRNEIGSLIGRLPPAANFNVILFGNSHNPYADLNLFRPELVPATTENKEAFFAWMRPVNTVHTNIGPRSAASVNAYRRPPFPDNYGFDTTITQINRMAAVLKPAIAMQPDTVFLITGEVDLRAGWREPPTPEYLRQERAKWDRRSDERRKDLAEYEKAVKELAARGVTPESIERARGAAQRKAQADLAEANRRLVAAGKQPVVNIGSLYDIERRMDELKRAGINLTIDGRGWKVDDQGRPIRLPNKPNLDYTPPTKEDITWNDIHLHINRLQRAFTSKKVAVTTMLFVGPEDREDRVEDWSAPLREISKRNDGKFQVLTTKRLEEILAAQNAARGP
jgi:hypothetical protein